MKNKIPPIIHLLCKDKRSFSVHLNRIKTLHPKWSIRLYDDIDIQKIMKQFFPHFMEKFNAFPKNIQRLDVFKMLILFLHGGFYMDMDIHLLKPLDSLLSYEMVLGEEQKWHSENGIKSAANQISNLGNYMLASMPEHPFMIDFAKYALSNAFCPVLSEKDVHFTTGKNLLTKFYYQKRADYPQIYLVHNPGLKCIQNCSKHASCHFGEYAVHHHQGSWHWNTEYNSIDVHFFDCINSI